MSEHEDGCCERRPAVARGNDPGQPALDYRIGNHATFLRTMVQGLSRQIVPPDGDVATAPRPLRALSTRAEDDGTMAILDAFACVCDVLTFHGERGFNEGFLTTATERLSIAEIARSLGYTPNPGAAATTRLAFFLDTTDAAPKNLTVPVGTPVMSVPGPEEQPVTFETTEALEARGVWNELRPAQDRPHRIDLTVSRLYLEGTATRLEVGDPIVVVGQEHAADDTVERWDLRFVTAVEIVTDRRYTIVDLDRPLGDHENMPAGTVRTHPTATPQPTVLTFRERASLFGFNAPDYRSMNEDVQVAFGGPAWGGSVEQRPVKWPRFSLAEDTITGAYLHPRPGKSPRGVIDLDREYPSIVPDGWVCLQDRYQVELYRVTKASPAAREDFTLAAKCTRVFLGGHEHLEEFRRRSTVVHAGSEVLPLAAEPRTDWVTGPTVELSGRVLPMPEGRVLMIRGLDAETNEPRAEVVTVAGWDDSGPRSKMILEGALERPLVRESVTILGNVAYATHGETIAAEVLGSGSASVPHARYALRQGPLTWLASAEHPTGDSTLELRIDDVRWHRVASLLDAGPRDRVYALSTDDEGRTLVQLGDGHRGARAPTGVENVVASYRKGLGLAGEVVADQLTLLRKRPLGVRAVTNPSAASGGADPESADDMRSNAPLTVLALDRLVSVQDFEDYARSFSGIGKARAERLWDGKRSFVHLTVASASGKPVDNDLRNKLIDSIELYQDPTVVAVVVSFVPKRFGLKVKLLDDPDWTRERIEADARALLSDAFSFARRDFGQPVAASEVISVLHGLPGVRAVDLDELYVVGEPKSGAQPPTTLPATRAHWNGSTDVPATLLVISPQDIVVEWMR